MSTDQNPQTILLVDDEDMVRDMGRDMLRFLGYQIITAENGQQAIEKFGQNKDAINLVIIDLLMPKMNGVACFQKIREVREDVPVVISSGISDMDNIEKLKKLGVTRFLDKPYTLQGLRETVEAVLK